MTKKQASIRNSEFLADAEDESTLPEVGPNGGAVADDISDALFSGSRIQRYHTLSDKTDRPTGCHKTSSSSVFPNRLSSDVHSL